MNIIKIKYMLSLAVCFICAFSARAENISQTFIVPLYEQDVFDAFSSIEYDQVVGTYMRSVTSIVIGDTNTVLYYDHWEDGYETSVFAPVQSTSLVLGDGNTTNGFLAAYPSDVFSPGDVIELDNDIPMPRVTANVYYDGRDKISSTKPVTVTRAMYPFGGSGGTGPLMAGAVQALDTTQHGMFYEAPVGEDISYSNTFDYVGMFILASEDPTLVQVDTNADGVVDVQQWLQDGESLFVDGGISVGATVSAKKPIQVNLVAGKYNGNYKVRLFTMFPRYQWSDEYVTPVSSIDASGGETAMFLHNPNSSSITVNYETTSTTGSVTVAGGATEKYIVPFDSGARFYTSGGERFVALSTISGGSYQAFDWGFSPVPSRSLSTMMICGLGWGSSDFSGNYSPVWVTSVSNTTIYVDYDADPTTGALTDSLGNKYDTNLTVNGLTSTTIYNPDTNKNDQTRMRLYTLDGTYLTGAYGSYPANPPTPPGGTALDLGTVLMPFPSIIVRKTHELWTDVNGDGKLNPGDSLKYILTVVNNGYQSANNVMVHDDLPDNVTYTVGSFATNGVSSADDSVPPASTTFPLDENGYNIGSLDVGASKTVSYVLTVDGSFPLENGVLVNSAYAGGSEGQWQDVDPVRIEDPSLSLTKSSSTTNPVAMGDTISYTLTVRNDGSHAQNLLRLTEELPSSLAFVTGSTSYVIETNQVQNKVRDDFNNVSFGNNDGSATWSGNWSEIGEADGPATGFVVVSNALSISTGGAGASRMVDMSGYSNALLRLTYRRAFVATNSQTVAVDISDDGGVSWHALQALDSSQNDPAAGVNVLYDISEYIASNTVVRLSTGGSGWSNGYDRVYFDGVEIEYTKPGDGAGSSIAGSDPPNIVELDSLAPYTVMTVTFDATVVSVASNEIVNSAYVVSELQQTELYAYATNNVASADLAVSKVAYDQGPYNVGDTVSFTVTVTNNGADNSTGVEVTDGWPATYITYSGASPSQGSYVSASNIWDVGSLVAGASASMVISGVVANISGITQITNSVEITASGVSDGVSSNNSDNAVVPIASSIGDLVWLDTNGDGIQDAGETGLSNVTVRLYDANTNLLATTVSDASGAYRFDGLFAGDYYVKVVVPTDHGISPENMGGNDAVDSDVDAVSGMSSVISLATGERNDMVDVGLYEYVRIGDYAWYDNNNNGLQDDGAAGDVGANGVQVLLYRDADGDGIVEPGADDGDAIATNTTYSNGGSDGYYEFSGYAPGDYYLKFVLPSGLAFTLATQNSGGDDSIDSDPSIAGGLTALFTLQSGDVATNWDAGMVIGATGLGITKTSDTGGVAQNPGDTIQYTITVSNTGTVTETGVSVVDTLPSGVTYVPGSTQIIGHYSETNTVRDEFNAIAYTNQDGSANWANDWQEINEANGPSNNGVRVLNRWGSDYQLKVVNSARGIWRQVDLSGYDEATLTFDYKIVGFDGAGEATYLSVSTNGGTSWVDLQSWTANSSQTSASYDLTPYISSTTAIAFTNLTVNGGGEGIELDNVQIEYDKSGVSTNSGGSAPNLASGYTLTTGQTMTVTFDATVESGTSVTQLINEASAASVGVSPVYATVSDSVAYADLAVYKSTTNGGPYDIGETVVYTVIATNNGPNDATGVELTDTWPASLNYSGNVSSQGSYNSGSHIWDVGSLAVGGYATMTISGVVNSVSAPDGITNVATVTASDLYDPVSGNNSDDAVIISAATVGNYIWLDIDGDGIQDAGETGISNVTVRLYDESDVLVATETTDTNGLYQFGGLEPGNYYIKVTNVIGYAFTQQNSGTNATVDSDVNALGTTPLFTLQSGDAKTDVDAGLYQLGNIGDYVWYDADKNGIQDVGESGTNGVEVLLYLDRDGDGIAEPGGDDGAAVGTNTTYNNGGDGFYAFNNYAPGSYFIKFALPDEMAFSDADIGGNDALDSDVDPSSGMTPVFSLSSGGSATDWDAGVVDAIKGLGISKTSDTGGAVQNPGDIIRYTISVSNTGAVTQTGVNITDILPPGISYVANSTRVTYNGSVTNTVRDEFSALSYANNDGSENWQNDWTDAQDGNPIAGDIRILQDNNGAYSLRFRDDSDSIMRSADLSAASSATLKLLYRRNGLDSSNEWVRLRASTNSGGGWTTLTQYSGAATDASYISASYDLTPYISTNTTISFWNDNRGMNSSNMVWFDDIEIEYVVDTSITENGGAAPNLATGYTLDPGQTMTVEFDALVDTPAGVTEVVNSATAVATGLASISATVTDAVAYADIAVDKIESSSGPYDVGDTVSFTIAASNHGPNDATGVVLQDSWPDNFITYSGATPSQGSYASGSHTWTVGSLSLGSTATLVVSGVVNSASAAYVTNVAMVSASDMYDPVASNNTDDAVITLSAVIGDYVWLDDNGDGVQDVGESGISNVTVKLYGSSTNLLSTTTSDANGHYEFSHLLSGDYYVEFVAPSNYNFSTPGAVADGSVDSDADVVSGFTEVITLATAERNRDIDAGLYEDVSIGDYVWFDSVADGVQGGGESGTNGVQVLLYGDVDGDGVVEPNGDDSVPLATTNTYNYSGNDGHYEFNGYPPGDYYIKFVLPAGMAFTTRNVGNDDALDSDATLANGFTAMISLSSGAHATGWDAGIVAAVSGLAITKTSDTGGVPQNPGETISYTITVSNTGTVTQTGVDVVDMLPAGVTYVPGTTRIVYPELVTNSVMDSFDAVSYSNNVGDVDWKNNWTDVEDGSPSAGQITVLSGVDGAYSLRLKNDNNDIWRSVDLSEAVSATLSLKYQRQSLDSSNEWVRCRIASNTNGSWSTLGQYEYENGNGDDAAFVSANYDISSYMSSNTTVSFWNDERGMGNGDYCWFDDVEVAYTVYVTATNIGGSAPNLALGYTLPAGGSMTVTFDVTVDGFSGVTQLVNEASASAAGVLPVSDTVTDSIPLPASIGDEIWIDSDGSDEKDEYEMPLIGVTVFWDANTNGVLDGGERTAVTDTHGIYLFDNLIAGTYRIMVDTSSLPAGLTATYDLTGPADGDATVTVSAGMLERNVDFGYIGNSSLGDFVWNDLDYNGAQDAGEPGISNVYFALFDSNSNQLSYVKTDSSGFYSFTNLPAGTYFIGTDLPDDYFITLTNAVSDNLDSDFYEIVQGINYYGDGNYTGLIHHIVSNIDLPVSTTDYSYDAGCYKLVTIGDRVWLDSNGNGIQDASETNNWENIPVSLINTNGSVVATTTTDADGLYSLSAKPGRYKVRFDLSGVSTNLTVSPVHQGVDSALDSDVVSGDTGGDAETDYFTTLSGLIDLKWDLGITTPHPTRVMIADFKGWVENSNVMIEWNTQSEHGTLYYDLYRRTKTGELVKVNDKILPALFGAYQGGVYRFRDMSAPTSGNLQYTLIEHEDNGSINSYGPYDINLAESKDSSVSPSSDSKEVFTSRAHPLKKTLKETNTKVSSSLQLAGSESGFPIRMGITKEGVYTMSAASIASLAGISEGDVIALMDANDLELSSQGASVAWWRVGNELRFYGDGLDSIYSYENVYWLDQGGGKRSSEIYAHSTVTPDRSEFFGWTSHTEENHFAPSADFHTIGELCVWDFLFAGGSPEAAEHSYTVNCPGVSAVGSGVIHPSSSSGGGSFDLDLAVVGGSDTDAAFDHKVVVSLNSTEVGSCKWDGKGRHSISFTCDTLLLNDGTNTVTVKSVLNDGVTSSLIWLDYIEMTYPRVYEAQSNALHFSAAGNSEISIGGFSNTNIMILDVSMPNEPVVIDPGSAFATNGAYMVSFSVTNLTGEYFAFGSSVVDAPDSESSVVLPDLSRSDREDDVIIIAPENFCEAAEVLADYRRGLGWKADVVSADDIYNEFNFGISDPRAIRRFLGTVLRKWNQPPRYIVLAGSGTYDYKDQLGKGDNLLPPIMIVSGNNGVCVSDARLADITGDGLPDFVVGRIPATTVGELSATIDRIIDYEAGGVWKQSVMMCADNSDMGGAFAVDSEIIAENVVGSGYTITNSYLDYESIDAVRMAVSHSLSAGTGLFNYIGHAGAARMADEGIYTTDDVAALHAEHSSVVLASSCDLAQFGTPGYISMGRALMTNGASAVWSATVPAYNHNSVALANGVFKSIFSNNTARLGDAIYDSFMSNKYGARLSDDYVLLGDPAIAVGDSNSLPRTVVVPDMMTFDEWQRLNFAPVNIAQSANDIDVNDDGIENYMAYVLNINATGGGENEGFVIASASYNITSDLVEISFWRRYGVSVPSRVFACRELGVDDWEEMTIESSRSGQVVDTMEEIILSVRLSPVMNGRVFLKVVVGDPVQD